ncbi:MAG TPA: carboxypeptidase regulatory-like domain-containing protein, partial [Candidatus Angelobacter sp.]|nr:carboxypeptidase regulatory-like domain-containing protein [Candidatus Angelobacter sp.]
MKRTLFAFATLAVAVVMVLGLAQPAFSQVTAAQAQLNGTVKDQAGGVIVKATVTLKNVDTNHVYTTTTNGDGFYILANIPPGNYELSAEFTGFGKAVQKDVVLRVAQVATIDISLKVAAATEVVEVKTEAPVIEPTRTEVSQVVATEQIQALPISGRLFTDFALLSPGVTTGRISLQSTFTDPSTTRISFGGQRDLSNSVTVDGADNINSATGSQRATPSQEAVSEFRVVNNSFGAEYGRALGGIVNIVTKSGTNDLHGSVYEYFQNNAVNAKSILTQPGFDILRQNQFGATLGGPIRKDRTFFFMNYEGQRRGQSPTYPALLVNNLVAINALKASLGIAPENLGVLKTADVDNGFIKLDHQLNEANRLSVRYLIQDATNLNMLVGDTLDGGGVGAPSSGRNGLLRDQSLDGTLTTQLSNTKVNSLLVQWARRNYGFPGVTGQPNLDVPNLLLLGHNFGAFDRYNETRLQFSDTYSMISGNHFAKFGVDTNYIRNFVIWPGFTPARVIFPSLGDLLVSGKSNWGSAPCPPPLIGLTAPCLAAFFWGAPIGPGPFNPNAASPSVPTTWQNAFLPSQASNFNVNLNHSYIG